MQYLIAVVLAVACLTPAPVSAASPFCAPGFTVTLPAERIVLERGQTFGDLDQYGVPHPIRHTVVAGWRLDQGDVAGAELLADELLAIAETVVESGDRYYREILYFPYLFEFPSRLGDLSPPWYSGMAQARISGLFARLYETTGAYRWKRAAIDTYRSLTRVDRTRRVWHWEGNVRWIDTFSWPTPNPVLNGHLYAIVGLHDLWRVTGVGESVLLQVIATIGTDGHRFMETDGKHHYDLARSGLAGRYYHEIIWEQMQQIGTMAPCLGAVTFYDPPS